MKICINSNVNSYSICSYYGGDISDFTACLLTSEYLYDFVSIQGYMIDVAVESAYYSYQPSDDDPM